MQYNYYANDDHDEYRNLIMKFLKFASKLV